MITFCEEARTDLIMDFRPGIHQTGALRIKGLVLNEDLARRVLGFVDLEDPDPGLNICGKWWRVEVVMKKLHYEKAHFAANRLTWSIDASRTLSIMRCAAEAAARRRVREMRRRVRVYQSLLAIEKVARVFGGPLRDRE